MVATLTENFEGANGVALTSGNTAFDAITGTGGTVAFSTAQFKQGASSALFATTSSRGGEITRTNATTRHWSFYIYPTAHPSANTIVLFVGASVAARTFQVVYNSAGTWKIQNSGGVIIGSNTTSTAVLNQWNRVDVSLVSGTVTMSLYPGTAACDNAVGTASAGDVKSGAAGATAITYVTVGSLSASTSNFYLDAFREDDTAVPTPIGGGAPPTQTVNAGTDRTGVEPYTTVTLTATSSETSVTWSQLTGTTVTLTGAGALSRSFVAPGTLAGETLTFRATAGSATDDVAVTVLAVNERVAVGAAWVPVQVVAL